LTKAPTEGPKGNRAAIAQW